MKTTKTAKTATIIRSTANPRRTTLMHLDGTETLSRAALPETAAELPPVTANPRRTVLMEAPAAFVPAAVPAFPAG
ncbi:hypothetical protein C6N75_01915 [Streptomyces solincola]|uniref:Uncharacterized protein n=1 Tax=Streptomyces solincola TaxID=2100817 RepID=A0A2S9Q2M4_9ACTN|nr:MULTISPECIES: hypothetical protein [Streptomyces]PRH80863.1 hypothetical protein C6N75_01915 [Streptomyces solincola]